MRKDEAVGNKKKMQLCLLKHNPDPALNLDADPDPDPDPGGGGVGQLKMCIPPGKILGTPLAPRKNC
jgi:hypothetical protein